MCNKALLIDSTERNCTCHWCATCTSVQKGAISHNVILMLSSVCHLEQWLFEALDMGVIHNYESTGRVTSAL
eukprot:18530-Heterococcus_DN1.PRE.5